MPHRSAQYPVVIFDGYKTGNPWRLDQTSQVDPDFNDYDQLAAEIIAAQVQVELLRSSSTDVLYLETVAGETIHSGQPVYVKQANVRAYRASAAFEETSRVSGFCRTDATSDDVFGIVPVGRLELADWTIPLGGTSLLIPGAIYYLDGVNGQITVNPPVIGFIAQIGIAVTTTALDINIKTRVRL